MKDIIKEQLQRFQHIHTSTRRYVAVLLVLSLLTVLAVNWKLHYVGISMTTDDEYYCGYEEHVHTDECYEEVLICGYEEGEPERIDEAFAVDPEPEEEEKETVPEPEYEVHHHTDECYEEVTELTCDEEEHVHEDYCYDSETGELLCTQEEHTHDENCYTTEEILICGYEEGEEIPLTTYGDTFESTPVVVDDSALVVSEPELHHHTEDCYEKVLTCTLPEHEHTLECLADYSADVETEDDWEKNSENLSSAWCEALMEVAEKQLGYTESVKNFEVDFDGQEVHHYSRYGAWYGNPYGDWDVMFVAFCQHYAGIPRDVIPQRAGLFALRTDLETINPDYLVDGCENAIPGDIVTYYNSNGDETIGIVMEVDETTLTVISGAVDGAVAEVMVARTDVTQTILVEQAYIDQFGDVPTPDDDSELPSGPLTFDPDEILEQEGAVAYVERLEDIMTLELTDTTASSKYTYNDDGSLNLNDLLTDEDISVKPEGSNEWTSVDQDTPIKNNTGVQVKLRYTVEPGAFQEGNNKATYTLPEGIWPKKDQSGDIVDSTGKKLGTFTIKKGDPNVVFEFDDPSKGFTGTFMFLTEISYEETSGTGKIQLGNKTFTIEPEWNIDAEKTGTLELVGGKSIIHYTVTVKAPYGTHDKTIDITDVLDRANSTATGKYLENSFLINGNPLSDYPDASLSLNDSDFTIKDLPALGYDGTYTLTYDVEVTGITGQDGSGQLINKVTSTSGKLSDVDDSSVSVKDGDLIKTGVYDAATQRITWTILVKNPGGDLKGYRVTDVPIQPTDLSIIVDVTIRNNHGTVYDTVDGAEFLKNGYTFTKSATDDSYTFTFQTNAPYTENGAFTAQNEAKLWYNEDLKYTSIGEVSQGTGVWKVEKNVSSSSPLADGTQKVLWDIDVTVPAGATKFQFLDILRDPESRSPTITTDLYTYISDLEEAFPNCVTFVLEDGATISWNEALTRGIKIEPEYFQDVHAKVTATGNDHVHCFFLNLSREDGERLGIIGMKLTGMPSIADTTGMTNNTQRVFMNGAAVREKTGSSIYANQDAYYTHKVTGSIEKETSSNKDNFKGSVSSTSFEKGKVLWYRITIHVDNANTNQPIVITDTLPEGTKFAPSANLSDFRVGFDTNAVSGNYYTGAVADSTDGIYWSQGNYNGIRFVKIDATKNGELTFTVFPQQPDNFNPFQTTDDHIITLRYALTIEDDTAWNNRDLTEKTYKNTASWNGLEESAYMTVKRPKAERLTKNGTYDRNTKLASYTITINPYGEDLAKGAKTLELTDVLTSEAPGMELQLNSVKLYEYVIRDGEWVRGDEVDDITVVLNENPDSESRSATFIVPNKKALVLEYAYKITPGNLAEDFTLTNTAELAGYESVKSDVQAYREEASATADSSILTVFKVDSTSNLAISSPATFELSHYNKTNHTWESLGIHSTVNGSFSFTFAENAAEDSSILRKGDLDCLFETKAPASYQLDATPHYFIWDASALDDTTKQTSLNNATDSVTGSDIPDVSNVSFFGQSGTQLGSLSIPNKLSVLTLKKVWYDTQNNTMDAPVNSIKVELYRYPADGSIAAAERVETITLTNADGWTTKIDNLESDYRYFVKEVSSDALIYFEASYSDSNTTGVTGGGVITITNTQKPSYELPSTGGSGTAAYPAVGGLLMAAAALLLVFKRRKQL